MLLLLSKKYIKYVKILFDNWKDIDRTIIRNVFKDKR